MLSLRNGTLQTAKPDQLSSRFIYEATNHRRSRFYFEAIGPGLAILTPEDAEDTETRQGERGRAEVSLSAEDVIDTPLAPFLT